VGEHDVSRDDWYRSQGLSEAEHMSYQESLRRLREINADRSATSAYINPNALCPVCGVPVYFYQNRWGSRVFFDELGKPWPKHPCTDLSTTEGNVVLGGPHESVIPVMRSVLEVQLVEELLETAWRDTQREFGEKYGVSQWDAFKVVKRLKAGKRTLLILDGVSYSASRRIFLTGEKVPQGIKEKHLIYHYRNWVSFFDLHTMRAVDHKFERIKGVSAFVEALLRSK
jgi:hypothetical protein